MNMEAKDDVFQLQSVAHHYTMFRAWLQFLLCDVLFSTQVQRLTMLLVQFLFGLLLWLSHGEL